MTEKTEISKEACCNNCGLASRCIWRDTILIVLVAVKAQEAILKAATKVCPFWVEWREDQ